MTVSPRPAPTTDDDLAVTFLQAGARLVDALLAPETDALPPRLKSLHFPAPLGWIRVEDVIREARAGGTPVSPKAFWNRWPDKDSYLVDLATYAITHVDGGGGAAAPRTLELRAHMVATDLPFSARIEALTQSVMTELLARPRSTLVGHLAGVVHHAPGLAGPLQEAIEADSRGWSLFYQAAIDEAGLCWRPGWDAARAQLVMKALIDGLLVSQRTAVLPCEPADSSGGSSGDVGAVYAAAATALFAGMIDLDDDRRTAAQVLDDAVASRAVASRAAAS